MAENENSGSFIVISDWMVSDLHLKGTELILFAVIHGATCEHGNYSSGISYLQLWTNCSKQGVLKCLKTLEQNGLIRKGETIINGRKFNAYQTVRG